MVAIAGVALAGTGVLWHMESRREKEKELLFIGEEYRNAIGSYFEKSPDKVKQYPQKLEDLLLDKRSPVPVRHLRRLYRDPMTEDGDWGLILLQGRITGVASKSRDKPIKIAGFPEKQKAFEGARHYADWQFLNSGGLPSTLNPSSPAALIPASGPD